jgi:hypothetical protein
MWSAGDGDDNRRFLADLRVLRDRAALEFDELAARAHYPSDVLKEAESGPSLPGLPILAAYVRACGGDVPEWEERWRRLGFESRADPGLPVRPAGASPAAVAGARAGVGVAPPESYDAERIRAVLRGAHGSSDRGGRGTASRGTASAAAAAAAAAAGVERDGPGTTTEQRVPESPANWNAGTSWDQTVRWDADRGADWDTGFRPDAGSTLGTNTSWDGFQPDAGPGWDGAAADVPDAGPGWDAATADVPDAGPGWDGATADLSGASANGNHHVSEPGDWASDTPVIETPDAAHADAIRRDPFSAAWLADSELTSPPDLEPGWQGQAEAGPGSTAPENWFTPRETSDREQTWASADTQPSPPVTDAWFASREQPDDGLAPERDMAPPAESTAPVTGFWTPSAPAPAPAPAEVRRPDPAQAEVRRPDPAQAEVRRPDPPQAEVRRPDPPQAEVRRPDPAQAEGHAVARTMAAVPPGPVVPPRERRADRLYPVRVLTVIVVAALIGSILVLLLR